MFMDIRKLLIRRAIHVSAMVLILTTATPLSAAIIGTSASVSITVQELIDSAPGSVSSDDDQLAPDASNLPLSVVGGLLSTDLSGALTARARGLSQFFDPAQLDQPNPEEFVLEAAGYANASSVAYNVTGAADESRTILFATEGNPLAEPEIDFQGLSTRRIESRLFFSGAAIFWATNPNALLDEMVSEFRVTVTREDTGLSVFNTTLAMTGENPAGVNLSAAGPIRYEIITLNDLRAEGVDEDTLAILEQVEKDGTLIVLAIPAQEHPYTYTVTADEPMVLTATFTVRVRNIPDGTGAAAVLGGPFENLADFIEEALPGVTGDALQRSINGATASRAIGQVPAPTTQRIFNGLCGAFGFESAMLLTLSGLCFISRRLRL